MLRDLASSGDFLITSRTPHPGMAETRSGHSPGVTWLSLLSVSPGSASQAPVGHSCRADLPSRRLQMPKEAERLSRGPMCSGGCPAPGLLGLNGSRDGTEALHTWPGSIWICHQPGDTIIWPIVWPSFCLTQLGLAGWRWESVPTG